MIAQHDCHRGRKYLEKLGYSVDIGGNVFLCPNSLLSISYLCEAHERTDRGVSSLP